MSGLDPEFGIKMMESKVAEINASLNYAPINSKLRHPPPGAYPGHLTLHRARGGEFEHCVERVGNLNQIYLLF